MLWDSAGGEGSAAVPCSGEAMEAEEAEVGDFWAAAGRALSWGAILNVSLAMLSS